MKLRDMTAESTVFIDKEQFLRIDIVIGLDMIQIAFKLRNRYRYASTQ